MRSAEFRRHVISTQEAVHDSLKEAREQQLALTRINHKQRGTHERIKEVIEGPEKTSFVEVAEVIQKLQFIQNILINIDINLSRLSEGSLKDLRPSQWKALKALVEFLKGNEGLDLIGYFKQPTGAGKTILFGALTKLMDFRTLILVPRNALLAQTKQELVEMLGFDKKEIGIVGEGNNEIGRKVTISTYQSHLSKMRSDKISKKVKPEPEYKEWVKDCEFVVCDEGHRSLGKKTRKSLKAIKDTNEYGEFDPFMSEIDERYQKKVLNRLREYTAPHALTIGVSATPKLSDKSMDMHFRHLIAEESFGDLVKAGTLAKFKIVRAEGVILSEEAKGRMTDEKEEKILEREFMARKLLMKCKEVQIELKKKGERLFGVAFCPTISECDRFLREATTMGFKCEIVTTREKKAFNEENHLPGRDRKGLVKMAEDRLLQGKTDFIITVDMLTEGWNCRPPNCAVINRITYSEARAIQGPGRVARAFTGKKYAYIFEGDWNVKGKYSNSIDEDDSLEDKDNSNIENRSQRKIGGGRKPLTLAAALHAYGENVEDVCEGLKGESVSFEKPLPLLSDENGIIIINGITGIGVYKYAIANGISDWRLLDKIQEAGLEPIGKARSGVHVVDIYSKKEVDALPYLASALESYRIQVDKRGIAKIETEEGFIKVITVNAYANANGLDSGRFQENIDKAGIKPIAKVRGLGRKNVDAYPKDAVDALPYFQKRTSLIDESEEHITVRTYAIRLKIAYKSLQNAIDQAGLRPLGQIRRHAKIVDFFSRDQIDNLDVVIRAKEVKDVELDDEGVGSLVEHKENIHVVCISAYASSIGMKRNTLKKKIEEAGIRSIGKTRRGAQTVDIYKKEEVDSMPYVRDTLNAVSKKSGATNIEDGKGKTIETISAAAYAKILGMNPSVLKNKILEAEISPVGKIKNGSQIKDVYPKNLVDSIPYVREVIASAGNKISPEGTVPVAAANGDIINAIGISAYSIFHNIQYETLRDKIARAGLQPIAKAKNNCRIVDVFSKTEVDKLIRSL